MWIMLLHLHVNLNANDDDDECKNSQTDHTFWVILHAFPSPGPADFFNVLFKKKSSRCTISLSNSLHTVIITFFITQLRMKYILLINVKMPTIVGI